MPLFLEYFNFVLDTLGRTMQSPLLARLKPFANHFISLYIIISSLQYIAHYYDTVAISFTFHQAKRRRSYNVHQQTLLELMLAPGRNTYINYSVLS